MVQPVAGSNAEDVLPTHVESMFRYERYIIAVIADFILSPVDGFIIGERGIRISVACVHAESIGQVSTQCRFSPIAPAFAGIDLNSGFETSPAIKNVQQLKEFVELIRKK